MAIIDELNENDSQSQEHFDDITATDNSAQVQEPEVVEKVEEDRLRDQMLIEAGYIVRRYTNIPSVRQLQKDIY